MVRVRVRVRSDETKNCVGGGVVQAQYHKLLHELLDEQQVVGRDERIERGHVGLLLPELDVVHEVVEQLGDEHQRPLARRLA